MLWTAAIVAGGPATRFEGRDKSSLRIGARSILDRQLALIRPLTDRILVVANEGDRFRDAALPVVPDLVPGTAALGGIYTALYAATTDYVLIVACDLPFLNARFLRHVAACAPGFDLTIPRTADGLQPMCAMYSRTCVEPIRARLAADALRVQDLAAEVRTREIGPDEVAEYDPDGIVFFNVNSAADYQRALDIAAHLEHTSSRPDDRITHVASHRQQDQ